MSLPAARRHLQYSIVRILIRRKVVADGHDITSLDISLNVEKYLTFLLEKRPHSGMPDEDLENFTPWSDEARAYCGYAQQIACI